ncbi:restriction endonuclease subunit S [Acinetobacter haemolyticus]|uniref:restriction endonuclease subunit S n=1 Tax=Acinetobacter haemolyticus TaxID=29430 RepID=UPI001331DE37|nr:restriction endonuclease subunit S [Acinetobacter haemolyticus]QHI21456.1 restriction endonuclease subunit S [Acinetobacter haemolyticus]
MATPKLRFKEFSGDWSNKKIGNIASKVGSGSTPRGGSEAYTDHGVIFIRSQNVNNDQLLLNDVAYIPEETHLKMSGSKVIANDILLNITGASIGRSCVVPHDFTEANVNQHVCIIRTPNDDPIFVQSFLSSENGQNAIQSKQAGGGREGLNFQAIRSIDFYFPPSKQEQTKIASFLSAVDEKISQLTQKHELLSQYKQGMMRKLFSQQIRFKAEDGSEFGEWEETILSDVVDLFHGYQFRTSDFTSKGIAVIKIGNVIGNNLDLANLTYINENRLEDFKKFEIQNDDILMSLTGNIGRIIEVKNKPFILLQNYRVGKFIPLNESFLIKPFLKYLLASDLVFGRFTQLANQSAQANFGKQDMDKITVFYPSVSEQTKIANFLSAIDQKIEVVAQQIEQAKQWKKGLLQQMFV